METVLKPSKGISGGLAGLVAVLIARYLPPEIHEAATMAALSLGAIALNYLKHRLTKGT